MFCNFFLYTVSFYFFFFSAHSWYGYMFMLRAQHMGLMLFCNFRGKKCVYSMNELLNLWLFYGHLFQLCEWIHNPGSGDWTSSLNGEKKVSYVAPLIIHTPLPVRACLLKAVALSQASCCTFHVDYDHFFHSICRVHQCKSICITEHRAVWKYDFC